MREGRFLQALFVENQQAPRIINKVKTENFITS